MRQFIVSACLFLLHVGLLAQSPQGTWVMAHIKAKQPVLSATMEQGELVFDEGAPFDSSEVYNPGLMTVQFEENQSATSLSWEGEELWKWQLEEDSLLMFGKKDTLYGNYTPNRMVLSSTIDQVPTEYTFIKAEKGLDLENVQPGWEAEVSAPDHPFDGMELSFGADTVTTNVQNISGLKLYLTTIGPLQVIEYSLNRPNGKVELGMIYLLSDRRKRYKGLTFPVLDDFSEPRPLLMDMRF